MNMKQKNKVALLAISLCAVMLFASACGLTDDKVFEKDGISITLDSAFVEKEAMSFNAYYWSMTAEVFIIKESFEVIRQNGFEPDFSLTEYAQLVIQANNISSAVYTKDGLTCFEYEADVDSNTFKYLAVVYKSSDAYWLVQFASLKKNFDSKYDDFIEWAKSVKFD